MPSKKESVVFSADAGKLSDAQLKDLQDKFGLKLHVRSSSTAISRALNKLGEVAVQNFDRTSPGYDRGFDRTGGAEAINPVINPVDIKTKIDKVAGKSTIKGAARRRGGKKRGGGK